MKTAHLIRLMISLSTLSPLPFLSAASITVAGTGAGNEFRHHVNRAFEFHVASPPDWSCQNCDEVKFVSPGTKGEQASRWLIESPEASSLMSIDFITDFPASNSSELLDEIKRREAKSINWSPFNRGSLVGFSSDNESANEAIEYYLVDRRMAIRIQWRKDGSFPQRAYQLDLIKASIDRAGSPPKLQGIRSESLGPYKVGDVACLLIEVDDLKSGFDSDSLKDLIIEGALPHWNFKSITWEGKNSWFRVCYEVTAAFTPQGLRIKKLEIEDSEDSSRRISCEARRREPTVLSCPAEDRVRAPEVALTVTPQVALIENPNPDLEGPALHSVVFDPQTGKLQLDATDQSGIAIGRVHIGEEKLVIFPDQIGPGKSIDLSHLIHRGWNTITEIYLFDRNGVPTVLRIPATDSHRQPQADQTVYEMVTWVAPPTQSNIKIVSFLKGGKK